MLPPLWLLLRDIGLFLLGATFAFLEITQREVPRDSVLFFAGGLLGGPLAANVIDSFRGGTSASSSSSPEAPPQGSSVPSSSGP